MKQCFGKKKNQNYYLKVFYNYLFLINKCILFKLTVDKKLHNVLTLLKNEKYVINYYCKYII